MGIELQFNSFSLDKNGDTLEKIAQEMSDLSSQPNLNKNINDSCFNLWLTTHVQLTLATTTSQALEIFFVNFTLATNETLGVQSI